MSDTEQVVSTEDFLAHYGVVGMKWGVRKSVTESSIVARVKNMTPEQKARAKKAAIGTGIIISIAGAAVATSILAKHGGMDIGSMTRGVEEPARAMAKKMMQEPTTVIHATRAKNKGFAFIRDGAIPNYLSEYEGAFGADSGSVDVFKRYGKDGEKVAVSFLDPEGRTDRAGRTIPHQIIVPKSMSAGINSKEDFMEKIWPQMKGTYDEFYDQHK